MEHLHQALEHPDNDDTAKMHPCCCGNKHVQERCGHDGEAKHPGRRKEKEKKNNSTATLNDRVTFSDRMQRVETNLFAANF